MRGSIDLNGGSPLRTPFGRVVVREFQVPLHRVSRELDGLRIAHVSDLHFRGWNDTVHHAQSLLISLDYDLLLVTGDFGNFRRHWPHAVEMTRRFFDPLAARGPIWAVLGNHDHPRIAEAADMPLNFLRNESVRTRVNGGEINIAGIEQTVPRGGDLDATLSATDSSLPTILLAHYPSTVWRLPPGRAQLVLSGHTHGGQIRVPWFGCLWPNDAIPRHMVCGLHRVAETHLHVSAGIGASLPIPIRLNCPPEITVLTLVLIADSARLQAAKSENDEIFMPAITNV